MKKNKKHFSVSFYSEMDSEYEWQKFYYERWEHWCRRVLLSCYSIKQF